jgi:hypothetical protein
MMDDVLTRMRNELTPEDGPSAVTLHLANYGMYNRDFVVQCLDELEQVAIRHQGLGIAPTVLERLAYQLLMDSAYIDLKHEREREERLAQYEKGELA